MTMRERALKLVEELPESRLETLIEFLASEQKPGDVIDEWGNLSAMTRASTARTMRRLEEQEQQAGHEP
ncbi:MAG TPA: hypothetical protein VIJ50_05480 [Solirubrobacteraceae bacterium]